MRRWQAWWVGGLALVVLAGLAWLLGAEALPRRAPIRSAAPVVEAVPVSRAPSQATEVVEVAVAPPVLAARVDTALAVPEEHAAHSHAETADPFGDLAIYAERPMSRVPHHVVRGWGLGERSRSAGNVGAYVVVDPGIDDDQLAQLARDIRQYHERADAVAVRIVDAEEAATYDRHSDGGELLEAHLVGRVQRDDRLELDLAEVRGVSVLEP